MKLKTASFILYLFMLMSVSVMMSSCHCWTSKAEFNEETGKSTDFKNAGEQDKYWAENYFENVIEVDKKNADTSYSKYSGEIKVDKYKETIVVFFDSISIGIDVKQKKYLGLLSSGLLTPSMLGCTKSNRSYYIIVEEVVSSNLIKIHKRRFVIKLFGVCDCFNPNIYYLELTNKFAIKWTGIRTFIKGSKVSFIKFSHYQI